MTRADWYIERRDIESRREFKQLSKQQRQTILSALKGRANKTEVATFMERIGLVAEKVVNSTTGETIVETTF